MGRLTERDKHGQGIWVEELHGNFNFFDKYGDMYPAIKKLAHYEDLEEQGRLIELPCAVRSRVYFILENGEIDSQLIDNVQTALFFKDINGNLIRGFYLTKEEALAKLKELEGE